MATRSKAMNKLNALWVVGTVDFSAGTLCKFTPNDQIIAPQLLTQLLKKITEPGPSVSR